MKYWLLFLVLAAPLAAGAKTITVSPGQSIQAAVDSASSGDLVEVLAGSYYQKVLVKGKSITLRGSAGAENTLIDGTGLAGPLVSFFEPEVSGSVLEGFTLANGSNPGLGGGAVTAQNNVQVTIRNNIIRDNSALIGAGVYVYLNSTATIRENEFLDNSASGQNTGGGAIAASYGGHQFILYNRFSGNSAYGNPASGGAVFISQGSGATIEGNRFEDNSCTYLAKDVATGGAVHVIHDTRPGGGVMISNNTFSNNSANYGGAVGEEYGASMMLVNNRFEGNSANYYGGAFLSHAEMYTGAYNINGKLFDIFIDGNEFVSNLAKEHGGAIMFSFGTKALVTNNEFTNNHALISGGAIHTDSDVAQVKTDIILRGNLIEGNVANTYGGGITVSGKSFVAIEDNTFVGNEVNSREAKGAGIYISQASARISRNSLMQHECTWPECSGGAIFITRALDNILSENNVIVGNKATYGSALFLEYSTLESCFDTYAENRSLSGNAQIRATIFPRSSHLNLHEDIFADADQAVSPYDGNNLVSMRNIQYSPRFVNRGGSQAEDYRLVSGSPGIDQSSTGISKDRDGRLRPIGHAYDVGAYEYAAEKFIAPIPLHRFWNDAKRFHFFSASPEERNFVLQVMEWCYEGPTFQVFAPDTPPPDTVPVYRFYSAESGHLYTIDDTEREAFEKDHAWSAEGLQFYAFAGSSHLYDTRPVYRFKNKINGAYFYTIDEGEKDFTMTLPDWSYQGIKFYAIASD